MISGCGKLYVMDGNWKLCYPICMYRVPKEILGFNGALKYVDSCPNQPEPHMAFCHDHCRVASVKRIPTRLKEYLKYAGINGVEYTKENSTKLVYLEKLLTDNSGATTAADCQGRRTVKVDLIA